MKRFLSHASFSTFHLLIKHNVLIYDVHICCYMLSCVCLQSLNEFPTDLINLTEKSLLTEVAYGNWNIWFQPLVCFLRGRACIYGRVFMV